MSDEVKVSLEVKEFQTYVPGKESHYPMFSVFAKESGFYPYSLRTDLSTTASLVRHRVVVIENFFARVEVFPDLGGHVYRYFDKVAEKEVFMVAPTIKFQNIAPRGIWIAGGIEFNFGRTGHSLKTSAPVAWSIQRRKDKSAGVWIGSTLLPIESRYAVFISLKPERSALDLEIVTQSEQVLPATMYWWTNTAEEVSPKSYFYYYGTYATAGLGKHSWPIIDGLDYRWYYNRKYGGDSFILNPQKDYMAFYDFNRKHGLAQIADKNKAPGQKYFTWGTGDDGRFWDLLLSDSNQTYCEIQRGRLSTQTVTEPLPAMSTDTWKENWYSMNNTGGFSCLENDLILNVCNKNNISILKFLSAVERKDLTIKAYFNKELIGTYQIEKLKIGFLNEKQIPLVKGKKINHVTAETVEGNIILNWDEYIFDEEQDWFREVKNNFDEKTASVDEIYAEAERIRFLSWPWGRQDYSRLLDKILEIDKGHAKVLRTKAEIALYNWEPKEAEVYLKRALEHYPADAELLILLGYSQLRQEHFKDSEESFKLAIRYRNWRKHGLIGYITALLAQGKFTEAKTDLEKVLTEFPNENIAMILKVFTQRKLGLILEAKHTLEFLQEKDPLWHRIHPEAFLLNITSKLEENKETRKFSDDSIIAASFYLENGFYDDAIKILSIEEENEHLSPAVRLVHLAHAFKRIGNEKEAEKILKQAESSEKEFLHPSLAVSKKVLEELLEEFPKSAILHLMLGNFLASREKIEAVNEWQAAINLGIQTPVVYRNLAQAEILKKDEDRAEKYYLDAWKVSKNDPYLFVEIDTFFARRGKFKESLEILLQLPVETQKRVICNFRHVRLLTDLMQYDEALEKFETGFYIAGEWDRTARNTYIAAILGKIGKLLEKNELQEAKTLLLKGLKYPRNINVGRSQTRPDESIILYFLGLVSEAEGKIEEAKNYWISAVCELHSYGTVYQAYEMLSFLALGNRFKAIGMGRDFELIACGEKQVHWHYGLTPAGIKAAEGFSFLCKGRPEKVHEAWEKALAEKPNDTLIRAHLNIPLAWLEKMSRKVLPITAE